VSGQTLARAGMVVAAAFFLSRVLGWVRLVVITNLFGASADLDAYFAAFRLPDAIFQLVAAGALSSALIPVLAGLLTRGEDDRAWRVVSTVMNLMLLVLAGLAGFVAIFAPQIVPIFTPGFDMVQMELTVRLTRIMLLAPIFLALGAVASSVLNARGVFGPSAVAPIVYNVAIITGALLLGPVVGVEALAIGVVVGSLFHLAVQLRPLARQGFRLSFRIDLGDAASRQVLLLMAPRALGLGANQITFLVNTMLASGVGVGAVTAYNVAFTVAQIPLGIIGFPLGVVLLPSMSRAIAQGSIDEFGRLVVRSLRLMLYLMLFITAVGVVLRRQVVTLLFDYGFDQRALDLTANTLTLMLVALGGQAMVVVLARAFYSGQDTRTPVIVALAAVAVNISISITTVGTLGLTGLALGIAVGAWFEATVMGIILWHRMPTAGLENMVRPLLIFTVGALGAGLTALLVVRLTELALGTDLGKVALLGQIVLASGAAAAVYAGYSLLLRIPELSQTVGMAWAVVERWRNRT
jgi:putative peptidoglycan lipid II flippase